MPDLFDPSGLDALLERLDPGRDARAAGLLPPAREEDLVGLPADLQALWRWHDGQAPGDPTRDAPLLLVPRFGITARLRPQGRLLSVAESRALARPGLIPVFDHPREVAGERAWIGRRDDGVLVYTFGPRAEAGRGGLAAWQRSLVQAHRALYMIDTDHFERPQRWVLAVSALQGVGWVAASDTFGMVLTPERGATVVRALHDAWDIRSPESARERIAALRLEAARPPAWVWARVAAIAGWCFRAGYLPLGEAWGHAVGAARALQATYRSWRELGAAEVAAEPDLAGALDELMTSPCSPWRLIAWETMLPAALPPPDEPEVPDVHVVSSSQELARTLFEAAPRSIVRLRAGRYRGSFSPRSAGLVIEAEAGAEVVLEGAGGAPVVRVASGTRLSGVVVLPDGDGVHVASSYLGVDGCAFEGGRGDALVVPSPLGDEPRDDTVLHVERTSVIEPGGSAVSAADGLVLASELTVEGAGAHGLHVTRRAELVASDVRVERPRRHGILARCGGVTLSRVTIDRPGQDGIRLEGGASALERVSVERAGRSGLVVDRGAEVVATSSVFAGSEASAVELVDVGPVALAHCRIERGGRYGAWLRPGHGARIIGTTIGGSRLDEVHVDGGRAVVISDADLGPSEEGAGLCVAAGGHVVLLDTVVGGAMRAGVVADASRVEMRGVCVTGAGHAVIGRAGARVAARDLTCRGVDTALVLEGDAHAAIELLIVDAPRAGGRVLSAREAIVLIGQLVAQRGALHVGPRARVAIAHGFDAAAVRVEGDGLVAAPLAEPPSPPTDDRSAAGARVEIALARAPFEAWGIEASGELLARVVARVAEDEGAIGVGITIDPSGRVGVSGPAPAVERVVTRARRALESPGAMGVLLAELVFEEPQDEDDEDVLEPEP
ncbi:MAG: DUF1266 domain-containing protein [Deltaproteobacteria bacterium]|nr:DUF1266 domain-containing protein [Deltaproteobacteria bacterium]